MIVGAAIVPSAPLLVPGISAALPEGIGEVSDAVDAVLEKLPDAEVTVLVAAGLAGRAGSVRDGDIASLAAVGRPDVMVLTRSHQAATARISGMVQYPLLRGEPLPLGLAALALLVGSERPLVPVLVPPLAEFEALVGVGTGIAQALLDVDVTAVVVAAGDCSAGLTACSPLHEVPGARAWDERAVAAVDSGRLDALARLGPAEAQRVGALGWAPMAVLHGACARAKIGMVLRHYSAPRGVGYLVAAGR